MPGQGQGEGDEQWQVVVCRRAAARLPAGLVVWQPAPEADPVTGLMVDPAGRSALGQLHADPGRL